jgi:hypothetical protein
MPQAVARWRWEMPPPKFGGPPVVNIRNTSSPHWRGLLKPENRCLVPVNSFAEYAPEPNPETKKDVVWFSLNEDRPLFAFESHRGTHDRPDRGEAVGKALAADHGQPEGNGFRIGPAAPAVKSHVVATTARVEDTDLCADHVAGRDRCYQT